MDLRIIQTLGTTEPVLLDETKNYLRVTDDSDDALITQMIVNARLQAEKFINSDIRAKERKIYLTCIEDEINLPYAPVTSVASVTVDGVALGEDAYELLGLDNPVLRLANLPAQKVEITYTTIGIDNESIRQGVFALAAWLYYGRTAKMATNWKSWLSPFKIFGYYGTR